MLVDPAFSSHFDSRTGLPGVRVNQVCGGFQKQYPYNMGERQNKVGRRNTACEGHQETRAACLQPHQNTRANLFWRLKAERISCRFIAPLGGEDSVNADIGARPETSVFAAVADPQRWDIFPRLRTKQFPKQKCASQIGAGGLGSSRSEERLMQTANAMVAADGNHAHG